MFVYHVHTFKDGVPMYPDWFAPSYPFIQHTYKGFSKVRTTVHLYALLFLIYFPPESLGREGPTTISVGILIFKPDPINISIIIHMIANGE